MKSIQQTTARTAALAAVLLFIGAAESKAADFMDSKCRDFRKGYGLDKRTIERPEPPYCVTMFGQFDEISFNSCRAEMQNYRNEVAKFTDCLIDESDRATEEFNSAVRSFNQKAGG
ncbi:hypothetical protein QO004_000472 [Rhizobium mesoamericanum]|uniref:hypothetical protein n=1 Tax=Rhizobium mesoamericanum TaxID=1079800 RepID=UPI0027803257|nr:hypothetical protein [Rhizobium mesoamericanum]MDQ0558697.1 hypothetical protein [Rhizobium mesoamericanum]